MYTMYLLDPEISDFILLSGLFCVKVVTELHQDFHCLWRGGRRKKKKPKSHKAVVCNIVCKSLPYFPRQNILQLSCVLCKKSVFRYVVHQMLLYEQGTV